MSYYEKVYGLKDVVFDGGYVGDCAVEGESSGGCDHEFAQEHNDLPDSSNDSETEGIWPCDFEAIFGCWTEIFASECDLYVSHFVDKLHDAFDTRHAAA